MNRELVGIREAAKLLGVTPSTVRRWKREGTLISDERTAGGYHDLARLRPHRGQHAVLARKTAGVES
ncbi:MAG: hypothetical protein C7B46_01925 [Sulfobacillus benefaciens]|uniref:HTH merR-type domain-containing protein n=1 Tax=Sulfobacillus benefaciens TaxID=453960 RepID=A0A2T2XL21_9FIRM|nr:MAG: hypothetical protein C7B46_01925 [Sulfobacillus benefaciens]